MTISRWPSTVATFIQLILYATCYGHTTFSKMSRLSPQHLRRTRAAPTASNRLRFARSGAQ